MGKDSRAKNSRNQSPGPGAYSGKYQVTKKKGPSYHVGGKKKPDFSYLNQSPGPGAYSVKNKSRTGWSFGGKDKKGKDQKFPGPGTYGSQTTFERNGHGGKSFGREKQRQDFANKGSPGPGQYKQEG